MFAHATVFLGFPVNPPIDTPEPAVLVMLLSGLLALFLMFWFRKKT
jgi:hypothetical protein